eukprot:jgi/Undpi1/1568/HiC_scaffold_11.g04958.m1
MAAPLQVAGVVGLCLSLYAVYVEMKHEEDPSYQAACDVSEVMSCSKVLTSEWGHIVSQLGVVPKDHPLDMANATIGVFYFSLVALHDFLPLPSYSAKAGVIFALTLPVVCVSLYLAYILFAVLQDVCLVCISLYAVDASVLYFSYRGMQGGGRGAQGSATPRKLD